MAGIRTCDRESQVQRPNHYTTETPRYAPITIAVQFHYIKRNLHQCCPCILIPAYHFIEKNKIFRDDIFQIILHYTYMARNIAGFLIAFNSIYGASSQCYKESENVF